MPCTPPEHLYIVTGSSRGLGRALVQQLLQPGHHVLGMARHTVAHVSAPPGGVWEQWSLDLACSEAAAAQLQAWLCQRNAHAYTSATLINNAGMLAPLVPLSACGDAHSRARVAQALRVGLEAPMLLTAAFLHATEYWPAARKVLHISSGLGRRAMTAQAPYCAAKAGLDHLARCLALDEAAKPHGAKVCSLAPGVIDTDMQQQLRSADAAAFPERGTFARLHQQGQLTSAQASAAQVLRWLARPDFGSDPVADVRQG